MTVLSGLWLRTLSCPNRSTSSSSSSTATPATAATAVFAAATGEEDVFSEAFINA